MSLARIQESQSHCEVLRGRVEEGEGLQCPLRRRQADRRSLCRGLETLAVVTPRPSGTT